MPRSVRTKGRIFDQTAASRCCLSATSSVVMLERLGSHLRQVELAKDRPDNRFRQASSTFEDATVANPRHFAGGVVIDHRARQIGQDLIEIRPAVRSRSTGCLRQGIGKAAELIDESWREVDEYVEFARLDQLPSSVEPIVWRSR